MKILLAVDAGESSAAAIEMVASRPWQAPTTVTIMTALEFHPELVAPEGMPVYSDSYETLLARIRAEADDLVADTRARLAAAMPGVELETRVVAGPPAHAILTQSEELGASLIVLGSHGRGALGRLMLGSVSNKVALQARCAVEVVKARAEVAPAGFKLLVPVDFSAPSEQALRRAMALPWPADTQVRLVCAIPPLEFLATSELGGHEVLFELEEAKAARRGAERQLGEQRAILAARFGDAQVTCAVVDGDPRDVIVDAARQWPATLILIGSHGRTGLKHLLLGSVANAVLHAAPCTVQIVK